MTDQNNLPVRLKGVGDSLWVTLDPSRPIDTLKKALANNFDRLRHLAVNARIILDPGNGPPEDRLIEELGQFLKDAYQVGQVSPPPPPKPEKEALQARQEDSSNAWNAHQSDALVMAGRVRSGQKIQAKKHLIILGDLNPGAEAMAGGDILIMGSLLGTALAGQPDNEDAIVMALDFRPTQIQIGGFVAAGTPAASGGLKPEYAHIENSTVVVDDYIRANPFKRLAWPEVR